MVKQSLSPQSQLFPEDFLFPALVFSFSTSPACQFDCSRFVCAYIRYVGNGADADSLLPKGYGHKRRAPVASGRAPGLYDQCAAAEDDAPAGSIAQLHHCLPAQCQPLEKNMKFLVCAPHKLVEAHFG